MKADYDKGALTSILKNDKLKYLKELSWLFQVWTANNINELH